LLLAAAFLAPVGFTASCGLDTHGLGLFDPVNEAGLPDSNNDSMVLPTEDGGMIDAKADVVVQPDADAKGDTDAASDAPEDSLADAPIDAPYDSPADCPVDAPEDSFVDAPIDAPVDSSPDAPADAADSGPLVCGTTGTVVFDPSMPCYVEGIYRAGDFLPPPDSSKGGACETMSCGNSPLNGDFDVLWVEETMNTGRFTSVKTPISYTARCTSYVAASPPTMTQLKSEMVKPSGWFAPSVSVIGTSYTLDAPTCVGSSVLYAMKYGP
jgi:hypothetical protein